MNRQRARPTPPHPQLARHPRGPFGWLEAELLHGGLLAVLGPHATSLLVLLAIVADRQGASYYNRDRMAALLGMTRQQTDQALDRLLDAGLVAHHPWRPGSTDGVWQLLPVPRLPQPQRSRKLRAAADVLRSLGLTRPQGTTADALNDWSFGAASRRAVGPRPPSSPGNFPSPNLKPPDRRGFQPPSTP